MPFRRYHGGIARHSQCKKYGVRHSTSTTATASDRHLTLSPLSLVPARPQWSQGGWPEKSARYLLDLLQNAESNAETKGTRRLASHRLLQHRRAAPRPFIVDSWQWLTHRSLALPPPSCSAGLEVDNLYIQHIQVSEAPKMRRRTYRAHGRINPFMACPCHIELILSSKAEVSRATDTTTTT